MRHTYACWFVSRYNPIWAPGGHFVTIFFMSGVITQTCLNRFDLKLVQGHWPKSYICLSICFTIQSNMAILWQFFHVQHVSTDFIQSWYKAIDLCHTYARRFFYAIQSNMAARRPFCYDFFMSGAITQTCLNQFHLKLVQGHWPMSYICTSICFAIWFYLAVLEAFLFHNLKELH